MQNIEPTAGNISDVREETAQEVCKCLCQVLQSDSMTEDKGSEHILEGFWLHCLISAYKIKSYLTKILEILSGDDDLNGTDVSEQTRGRLLVFALR